MVVSDLRSNGTTSGLARDYVLAKVVRDVFKVKPFIIFKAELEKDKPMAKKFLKAVGLVGNDDETTKEKMKLWIDDDYKNKFRDRHKKRRNNLHQAIQKTMESKYLGGTTSN